MIVKKIHKQLLSRWTKELPVGQELILTIRSGINEKFRAEITTPPSLIIDTAGKPMILAYVATVKDFQFIPLYLYAAGEIVADYKLIEIKAPSQEIFDKYVLVGNDWERIVESGQSRTIISIPVKYSSGDVVDKKGTGKRNHLRLTDSGEIDFNGLCFDSNVYNPKRLFTKDELIEEFKKRMKSYK